MLYRWIIPERILEVTFGVSLLIMHWGILMHLISQHTILVSEGRPSRSPQIPEMEILGPLMSCSLPRRCHSCVLRPLPPECRRHLPEPRHGGVVGHRMPAGPRHPRAPSRGGHRQEDRSPILQFGWAEWEGDRSRSHGPDGGKVTATNSLFTVHFCWFLSLPGSVAAHDPLLKYKSILGRSCPFASFRELSPIIWISYIQNRAALPFKKRGVGDAWKQRNKWC